jgi:hypothetical protein
MTEKTNTILIHFMDDKTVTIAVPPEKTERFMECLKTGETYMDGDVYSGIWVPEGNIRYAHITQTPVEGFIIPEGTQVLETKTSNETVEEQITHLDPTDVAVTDTANMDEA